ncbi:MAG: DUF1802 family protein [Bryobacterales bacterium]|nr:DUF1802 family protein [Bryobacterales bacterium]
MKEWASITEALAHGRQIAILRKGGIVEADRSGFQLRHREFLLFPTHEHQHARMLRPEAAGLVQPMEEGRIPIGTLARVTEVRRAPADAGLLLHDEFIWNQEFLDQRYLYRPDLPLWLIVIRAYRLPEPVIIPDRASYAGCKSWVNLTEEIEIGGAQPALSDAEFARRCAALGNRLG